YCLARCLSSALDVTARDVERVNVHIALEVAGPAGAGVVSVDPNSALPGPPPDTVALSACVLAVDAARAYVRCAPLHTVRGAGVRDGEDTARRVDGSRL